MPEFSDKGLIIRLKKYGEHDAVATFFTQNHGVLTAFVKRAFSKRHSGVMQVGNLTALTYKARLEEQLGVAVCENMAAYAGKAMANPDSLGVLSCICALLTFLPEGIAEEELFSAVLTQADLLDREGVYERYAEFEVLLLAVLGFGLDLSCCALTGDTENLAYVSPKSGRAVSLAAGEPWKGKLLDLPAFLWNKNVSCTGFSDIKKALALTGFFLENYVCKHINCDFPPVRRRLFERVSAK